MIVQHPNGNSYIFVDNKIFVSAFSKASNSVITVQLDFNNLNEWEKQKVNEQPTHYCKNHYEGGCYSNEEIHFGEEYCSSCNAHYKMMSTSEE